MKVIAKSRNLAISAQKLRLQIDGVGGQRVENALAQLAVRSQKGAGMVFDTISSAAANAENNNNLKRSNLYIDEIRVDEAAKLKRWRPRSRGMTAPISHQRAHLKVVLSDEVTESKSQVAKDTKSKQEVKK